MYVITGGAGFLGSAMIWQLNQRGIEDIVVVDNLAHSDKWKNLVNGAYADYIHKDVFLDMVRRDTLPFSITAVVHLGACSATTEANADYLMENNFHYSRDLCLYTLEKGARFINASSAATYGDGQRGFDAQGKDIYLLKPLNMYGYSKHLFDLWLLRQGLEKQVASLKFFNVYGPNEYHKAEMRSVVCKAYEQILQTGLLRLFRSTSPDYADGGQMRDFVYVKDCTALMDWLLQSPTCNGILNVGTGKARSWAELAAAVFGAVGRKVCIEYLDMPEALRGKYQNFTQADMTWLARCSCPIGWHGLEQGVQDYVQTYLAAEDKYL